MTTMRYRLRTLLIDLSFAPPILVGLWLARSYLLPAFLFTAAVLLVAIGSGGLAVLATMTLVWILEPIIFILHKFRSALRRNRRQRMFGDPEQNP